MAQENRCSLHSGFSRSMGPGRRPLRNDGAQSEVPSHHVSGEILERYAVQRASGLVAVSPEYVKQLRRRYPKATALQEKRCRVLPFAAFERDLALTGPGTGRKPLKVVYVGAGGAIMAKSFHKIAETFRKIRVKEPELITDIRIEFLGTDSEWQPNQPRFLGELASSYGLQDVIFEEPARITYPAAMKSIAAADGLIILGVDDPAYMPSKLFTYALTGKPLLVCLHKESHANRYFNAVSPLGNLIHFSDGGADKAGLNDVRDFLCAVKDHRKYARREFIEEHLAPAMAQRHAELFEQVLSMRSQG